MDSHQINIGAGIAPRRRSGGALTRTVLGLIFTDAFGRADGAPGANWSIESGAWAIVGGKLQVTLADANAVWIKCVGAGSLTDCCVTADVFRSSTVGNASLATRRTAVNTHYLGDIGSQFDASDSNRSRIYRIVAGAATRLTGGATGFAGGITQRHSFTCAYANTLELHLDGIAQTGAVDATPIAGPGDVCLIAQGNGMTATFDNVFVTKGRTVKVTQLPLGYKVRCNGLTSAGASGTGIIDLDLGGPAYPIATGVEILTAADVVVATLAGDVYGGDEFSLAL